LLLFIARHEDPFLPPICAHSLRQHVCRSGAQCPGWG
jgi:hypothetical protein